MAHPRNMSLPPESNPKRRGLSALSPLKSRQTRRSSTRAGCSVETSHTSHSSSTPASNTHSNVQDPPASARLCRRIGMPLWARSARGLQARAHLRGLYQTAQSTLQSGCAWPRTRESRLRQIQPQHHSPPQTGEARSTSASCHSSQRRTCSLASRDPLPPTPPAVSHPSRHLCPSGSACPLPPREERHHGRAASRARKPRPLISTPALASCVIAPCIRLPRPPRWCCTIHHWSGREKNEQRDVGRTEPAETPTAPREQQQQRQQPSWPLLQPSWLPPHQAPPSAPAAFSCNCPSRASC